MLTIVAMRINVIYMSSSLENLFDTDACEYCQVLYLRLAVSL